MLLLDFAFCFVVDLQEHPLQDGLTKGAVEATSRSQTSSGSQSEGPGSQSKGSGSHNSSPEGIPTLFSYALLRIAYFHNNVFCVVHLQDDPPKGGYFIMPCYLMPIQLCSR